MRNFLVLIFIIWFIMVIHFGGRFLIQTVFWEKVMDSVDVVLSEINPYKDLSVSHFYEDLSVNKFSNDKQEDFYQDWDLSFLLNSDNPCDRQDYYSDKASETLREEDFRELSKNWVECGVKYFWSAMNKDAFQSGVDASLSLFRKIWSDKKFKGRRAQCKTKRKDLDPKQLSETDFYINLCDFLSYIDNTVYDPEYIQKETVWEPKSYSPSEINENICNIKWNISFNGWEKIYHLPWCPDYDATKINISYWERWFCSEEEAINAGWRRAYNCD